MHFAIDWKPVAGSVVTVHYFFEGTTELGRDESADKPPIRLPATAQPAKISWSIATLQDLDIVSITKVTPGAPGEPNEEELVAAKAVKRGTPWEDAKEP